MVSERFVQRAKRCIASASSPSVSWTTATGLPPQGAVERRPGWSGGRSPVEGASTLSGEGGGRGGPRPLQAPVVDDDDALLLDHPAGER